MGAGPWGWWWGRGGTLGAPLLGQQGAAGLIPWLLPHALQITAVTGMTTTVTEAVSHPARLRVVLPLAPKGLAALGEPL